MQANPRVNADEKTQKMHLRKSYSTAETSSLIEQCSRLQTYPGPQKFLFLTLFFEKKEKENSKSFSFHLRSLQRRL